MKEKSKTDNFDILAQEFKCGTFTWTASKEPATFCKLELKVFLTKDPKNFRVVINMKGSDASTADKEKLRTTINFDDIKRFEVLLVFTAWVSLFFNGLLSYFPLLWLSFHLL